MNQRKGNTINLNSVNKDLLNARLKDAGLLDEVNREIIRSVDKKQYPLSSSQKGLWFIQQLNPKSAAYNIFVAYRIFGKLNVEILENAFNNIVQRHEILRTVFIEKDGDVFQQVLPHNHQTIQINKKSELYENINISYLANSESNFHFDLSNGPLIRLSLIDLEEDEYILFINMHHIISDGWSMEIFTRELSSLYKKLLNGESISIDYLPIQYGDYAKWQQEMLTGGVGESEILYWTKKLKDSPKLLTLPTDYKRPNVLSSKGEKLSIDIPDDAYKDLLKLCQVNGASLFMVLLANFKILLHKYTGEEDIVVGTTMANRYPKETEELMGLFVNTLPIRTNLSDDPSFNELLKRVKDVSLEAFEHQKVPFEKIIEVIKAERYLNHNPVFQIMFNMIEYSTDLEIPGLKTTVLDENINAKYDLVVHIYNINKGLNITIEYSTDLFEPATIKHFLRHYYETITQTVSTQNKKISKISILTNEESKRITRKNYDNTQVSSVKCLHKIFEEQVIRAPNKTALVFEGQELTYSELDRRADQIANYLQKRGIGPNEFVGICMDRSIDLIVGILGVLKAGGAYVPIDPRYPEERIAFMLEDSGINLCITQSQYEEKLSSKIKLDLIFPSEVINLQACDSECFEYKVVDNPSNLAYMIYTSGSTGQPKGVLVSHSNVTRLFSATDDWFKFNEEDVWTLFHSCSFDFSVWEIWGPLLKGGKLVIVPYWTTKDPEAFCNLLEKEKVTVLNQTPSAFKQIMNVEGIRSDTYKLSLRFVIFGGEALDFRSLKPWIEKYGDKRPEMINMYGITETTVHVTYQPVKEEEIDTSKGSVIGVPIPDLEVYVMDKNKKLVPIGVPGELYVGGAGVTKGYHNRPELTKERFIKSPFSEKNDALLYKTGDMARCLSDGRLEYLGRSDNQVKVNGYRIELAEIESVLMEYEYVKQAAVVVQSNSNGGGVITAYWVSNKFSNLSPNLREYLLDKLPSYMIPSMFIKVDSIPLTPTGKLDIKALPSPNTVIEERESYDLARNEIDKELIKIWEEVLELPRIGINDNFFEIGGDSILCIKVLSKARKLGLDFSLQQMYEQQTIRNLTDVVLISSKKSNPRSNHSKYKWISKNETSLLSKGIEDAYPLTRLQEGMLFHSDLNKEIGLYHNILSLRINAPYFKENWANTIGKVMKNHPILRTTIELTAFSKPLQLVHETMNPPVYFDDLRHLKDTEQRAYLEKFWSQHKVKSFDYKKAPLFRIYFHRISNKTTQLTMIEHHAIFDGLSVVKFLMEIFSVYEAEINNKPWRAEEPLKLEFRDYVDLELKAINDKVHQDFWRERIQGYSYRLIRPRNAQLSKIQSINLSISNRLSDDLKRLTKITKTPLKNVLFTAHLKLVNMILDQEDIVTGLVTNGRLEEDDGDKVLGLFLNTLPFRLKFTNGSWLDLIKEGFRIETELLPFRRYPMEQIVRDSGNIKLFETAFNFVHFQDYNKVNSFQNFSILEKYEDADTNFPLLTECSIDTNTKKIHIRLECNESYFSNNQINLFSQYFINCLEAMIKDPHGNHKNAIYTNEDKISVFLNEDIEGSDSAYDNWKKQLYDPSNLVKLPTQINSNSKDVYKIMNKVKRTLDDNLTTDNLTLLSVFKILLYRYTNENNNLIAVNINNKNHAVITNILGKNNFRDVLEKVNNSLVEARNFQKSDFKEIYEEISLMIGSSSNLKIQYIYGAPTKKEIEYFDLIICIQQTLNNSFEMTIYYNKAQFEEPSIIRMMNHLLVLLKDIAKYPEKNICEFNMLTNEERDTIINNWNNTHTQITNELLHSSFFRQVNLRGKQLAVISNEKSLTYEEVSDYSNRIAYLLKVNGIRRRKLVGVFMEKGWEQIVAVLGILQVGAAYLPLDPGLPHERLLSLIESAEVDLILTQSTYRKRLEKINNIKQFTISESFLIEHIHKIKGIDSSQDPSDLAYVIFTSGSTGTPKGVAIDHRGAVNTIKSITKLVDITEEDRILSISSLSFDLSVYDIFGILGAGGVIILPDSQKLHDPEHWFELCEQYGVTVWNSVPTLLSLFVDYLEESKEHHLNLLRICLLSGDWIPLSLPSRFKALTSNSQVMSLGGATEASIWSIYYPINKIDSSWKSIPYGRPLMNQTFYVLNEALEFCPIGIPGELYIGGIGVAKGYWKDIERTKKSFIIHPYTKERLYRTGDTGRFNSNGIIEFLGRNDDQVKFRGFRIELGEITENLRQHIAVKDAVTLLLSHKNDVERLVAYIVLNDNFEFSINKINDFLEEKLPNYMLPTNYVILPEFPLSATGKLDRKALPIPTDNRPQLLEKYIEPRSNTERTVSEIWSSVLGINEIGINDNFFDLGGYSLLVTKVVARLKNIFKIDLSLKEFYYNSTISSLSLLIDEKEVLNSDNLIDMFDDIDNLSEEDVEKQLEEKMNRE